MRYDNFRNNDEKAWKNGYARRYFNKFSCFAFNMLYWAFSCQNAANQGTFFVICTKVLFGCYIKNIEKFTPLMLIFTPLFGGVKGIDVIRYKKCIFYENKA